MKNKPCLKSRESRRKLVSDFNDLAVTAMSRLSGGDGPFDISFGQCRISLAEGTPKSETAAYGKV